MRPNPDAERALKELGAERVVQDTVGPAVYVLPGDGGSPMSAIACPSCRTVRVVLSIPRRSLLVYRCPCGGRVELGPPLEVVVAGNRPVTA